MGVRAPHTRDRVAEIDTVVPRFTILVVEVEVVPKIGAISELHDNRWAFHHRPVRAKDNQLTEFVGPRTTRPGDLHFGDLRSQPLGG